MQFLSLGNLLLGVALVCGSLIVLFECIERRRESKRERTVLEMIETEYRAYFKMGRL